MSTTGAPSDPQHDVILVPGAVLPAELAYGALLEALGDEFAALAKELEVYAGDEPPPGYTLELEVEGVLRVAEAAEFERFHLVGYSAGGASSVLFAARHPERLQSLALLEPAWAGNEGLHPAEEAVWRAYRRITALPPDQMMPAFMRASLRPGVGLPSPPPGPAPPWMAKRPLGLNALIGAFAASELDLDALRRFRRPVYFGLGGLSNPDHYARIAERLAGVFSTSPLRCSRDATTSTPHTGLSPSGLPRRSVLSGLAPRRPQPPRASY